MSANVVLVEFNRVLESSSDRVETMEEQLAYMESFMLLTGYAFENLYKDIDVARNPKPISEHIKRWNKHHKRGHGISSFAKELAAANPLAGISAEEVEFLERLDEWIWAGRYIIPISANDYRKATSPPSRRAFIRTDPELSDKLFNRLSVLLEEESRRHPAQ